jgi:hypothetical protein
MTGIPFTQYLLPDGRRRPQWIERPADIETLAAQFIAAGGRYECEMLTTGEVSFTAMNDEDETVAIEVCQNGPDVPLKVDQLIRNSMQRGQS